MSLPSPALPSVFLVVDDSPLSSIYIFLVVYDSPVSSTSPALLYVILVVDGSPLPSISLFFLVVNDSLRVFTVSSIALYSPCS